MRSFVNLIFSISVALTALSAAAPDGAFAGTSAGKFAVMSYNVRGLPPLVAGNRKEQISAVASLLEEFHTPLGAYNGINSFIGLQEVFSRNYHDVLMDNVSYEYRTVKDSGGAIGIGDGINILSDFRIEQLSRTKWRKCHGTFGRNRSDCDTNKGFVFARVHLDHDLFVDVYTLHADAGQDKGSRKARRGNITQLVRSINELSPEGTALIVLGDTNSLYTRAGHDDIQSLLAGTGVKDVWVELRRGGVVPAAGPLINEDCLTDPGSANCELVDKIFFRSGDRVGIAPKTYQALKEIFSDTKGRGLSDHYPVAVTFEYTRLDTPGCPQGSPWCTRCSHAGACGDDRAGSSLAGTKLSGARGGSGVTAAR